MLGHLACLVVDLVDGADLLAGTLKLHLVDLADAGERAVEVFHLFAVAGESLALFRDLLQRLGERLQLLHVADRGLFHLLGVYLRKLGLLRSHNTADEATTADNTCACRSSAAFRVGAGFVGTLCGRDARAPSTAADISTTTDEAAATDDASTTADDSFAATYDTFAAGAATTNDDGAAAATASDSHSGTFGTLCALCHLCTLCVDVVEVHVRGQILAVLGLVERTVEAGDEEHEHLGAHTQEQPEVGSRQVGELEERTKNHNRGTPAIGIVHERLSGDAVEPLLQAVDYVEFAVFSHLLSPLS